MLEPAGMGEVMKANHGTNAAPDEGGELFPIAFEGSTIPGSFFGLDAAPLHGKTQGVEPQVTREVEVALRMGPPVAGGAGAVAAANVTGVLPVRPLAVVAVALNLVPGGRNPPKEVGGKRAARGRVPGLRQRLRWQDIHRGSGNYRQAGRVIQRGRTPPLILPGMIVTDRTFVTAVCTDGAFW